MELSDMKKGDVIERQRKIEKGQALWHNLNSLEEAQRNVASIGSHYNLPSGTIVEAGHDPVNSGMFAVLAGEDTFTFMKAKVNWRVDNEVGITHLDTDASEVIDLRSPECESWVVIESSEPVYQSAVEHMTDDQLRESLEAVRTQRAVPAKVTRVHKEKAPVLSAKDKQINEALRQMTPEAKLELQRKLGLID